MDGKDILLFMKKVDEAFKSHNIEFGEVELECPVCGGKVHANKINTPNTTTHKITIGHYCEQCDLRIMN